MRIFKNDDDKYEMDFLGKSSVHDDLKGVKRQINGYISRAENLMSSVDEFSPKAKTESLPELCERYGLEVGDTIRYTTGGSPHIIKEIKSDRFEFENGDWTDVWSTCQRIEKGILQKLVKVMRPMNPREILKFVASEIMLHGWGQGCFFTKDDKGKIDFMLSVDMNNYTVLEDKWKTIEHKELTP